MNTNHNKQCMVGSLSLKIHKKNSCFGLVSCLYLENRMKDWKYTCKPPLFDSFQNVLSTLYMLFSSERLLKFVCTFFCINAVGFVSVLNYYNNHSIETVDVHNCKLWEWKHGKTTDQVFVPCFGWYMTTQVALPRFQIQTLISFFLSHWQYWHKNNSTYGYFGHDDFIWKGPLGLTYLYIYGFGEDERGRAMHAVKCMKPVPHQTPS